MLSTALTSCMCHWRHLCATDRVTARLQLAQRIYSLAQQQNEVAQLIGACSALADTNYALGDFKTSYQYAIRGVELWRSGDLQSTIEEVSLPGITCLCYLAFSGCVMMISPLAKQRSKKRFR